MAVLTTEIIALADYVSLSHENKLTIAGIFDRFFIRQVPVNWPSMFLVVVFRGEPGGEHKVELRIDSEQEQKIMNQELPVQIGPNGKSNFITKLKGFPLKSYGVYKLILSEKGNDITETEFIVAKQTEKRSQISS